MKTCVHLLIYLSGKALAGNCNAQDLVFSRHLFRSFNKGRNDFFSGTVLKFVQLFRGLAVDFFLISVYFFC